MQIGRIKFTVLLAAAFIVGILLTCGVFTAVLLIKDNDGSMEDRYGKLEQLMDAVEAGYYKDVDEETLMEGAYKGLVEALGDPYSAYLTADEYREWMESVTGEYSGIGITFTEDADGNFVVVSVMKDSPAEKSGLLAGDILLAADGEVYDNMDMLSNAIKGEAGTDVTVSYSRNGVEASVKITRADIVQHSVEYEMLDSDTAYIEITSFIESTGDDFTEALESAENSGAKELVLDLRDNGGGLVDQCIEIADAFIEEGPIVIMEGNHGDREEYEATAGKSDLKVVVLVNENSASAAEILAAALQDNGIVIVGQTTFGKGVVQSTGTLDDGSALKLTIMQYFSPKGNQINEKGVTPDRQVEDVEETEADEQLQDALNAL